MAREKGRNRQRRRRGRFSVLYKLLSFLLILAALIAGSAIFFRVNEITVEGNSRYTAEEIVRASGVETGDNLFLINKPKTVRSITRNLPYVEKVSVVKALPDALELRVTESVAAAYLQSEEGMWLVNSDTKAVELTQEAALVSELPRVLGLKTVYAALGVSLSAELEEQLRLDGLRELMEALDARDMIGGVTEFYDLSSSTEIYFGYGKDLTVVMPTTGNFDRLVYSLQGVLETCEKQGQLVTGTLDLTYGDKTAHLLTERWLPEELEETGTAADVETTPEAEGGEPNEMVEPEEVIPEAESGAQVE